jgi:hypothetical protein
MVTSTSELIILAQHNEFTSSLSLQQRLIFSGKSYKIVGIDDISEVANNKGIIQIGVELTSTNAEQITESGTIEKPTNGWGEW